MRPVLRSDVKAAEERGPAQLAVVGDANILPAIAERKDVSRSVEVDDLALIGHRHRHGEIGDLRRREPRVTLAGEPVVGQGDDA